MNTNYYYYFRKRLFRAPKLMRRHITKDKHGIILLEYTSEQAATFEECESFLKELKTKAENFDKIKQTNPELFI